MIDKSLIGIAFCYHICISFNVINGLKYLSVFIHFEVQMYQYLFLMIESEFINVALTASGNIVCTKMMLGKLEIAGFGHHSYSTLC